MIHFLQIVIQSKGIIAKGSPQEDFRAFLQFADSETMKVYELRGYGDTAGGAADDAWRRYKEDPLFYIEDSWEWK
jgi:hypothetical protein